MGLFDSWKEQREIRKLRARLELQALRRYSE